MLVTLKIILFNDSVTEYGLAVESYPRHRMKILCESEDIHECDRARANYYKKHSRENSWIVIIPKELIMNPVSLISIDEENDLQVEKLLCS